MFLYEIPCDLIGSKLSQHSFILIALFNIIHSVYIEILVCVLDIRLVFFVKMVYDLLSVQVGAILLIVYWYMLAFMCL